ncbi:MAG TPA: ABC transporter ATP-binding protein, partial [Candidatus Cloacimonetes bacterium]|nr:ABC transporter ATP-binding protein [Candidatus Cloacimonadota bacterium]
YYEHLLSLSRNFFNKAKTGDLMAYATNDLNAVRFLVGFGMVILIDIVVFAIGAMFFMTNISLRLTLLAIIPMPVLTVVIIIFGKKIHARFKKVQKTFATMSGKVQESISGIRVVKVFVQEEAELKKVAHSARDYVKDNIALVRIHGLFHPFLFLIIAISMGIVLIFGGESTILGTISMGEFIAFFSYLGMFVWPAIAVGWLVNLYQRGKASLIRLNSIFEIEPEIIDENADYSIKELKGKIEVKNLSFSYGERMEENLPNFKNLANLSIFENISFDLNIGKTLAIVGKTGCGKTTLIDLITRIYNPPKNSIFIDDRELYDIPLEILRKNIITVPQDIFLFSDSIANNISLAKPEVDKYFIEEVARYSQVYDEILEFENGFETVIGERGVTLSGGQKQRIAIARALLTDPNILILDDALSAVDTKTEKKILELLIKIRKDKTTIIIAHRISSLQHADKVIVLDNKKIVETGTHQELLANGGMYSYLYEKQQLEEKLSD